MDTSIFSHINWLAVLVATLAYYFAGAIWYHKAVFGSKWAADHGLKMDNPEAKASMGKIMIISFGSFAIIVIAIAFLVVRLNLTVFMSGVKLGLLTGIGISWMTISISYLYTQKPMSLHFIDGMFHVLGQVIVGIILCLWR